MLSHGKAGPCQDTTLTQPPAKRDPMALNCHSTDHCSSQRKVSKSVSKARRVMRLAASAQVQRIQDTHLPWGVVSNARQSMGGLIRCHPTRLPPHGKQPVLRRDNRQRCTWHRERRQALHRINRPGPESDKKDQFGPAQLWLKEAALACLPGPRRAETPHLQGSPAQAASNLCTDRARQVGAPTDGPQPLQKHAKRKREPTHAIAWREAPRWQVPQHPSED